MFKTITNTTYVFPVKDGLSWELQQRISKYICKKNKTVDVGYTDDHKGIQVSIMNSVLPEAALNFIDKSIPTWIAEIEENERKENKLDILKIKNFLADYKEPIVPATHKHKTALNDLLDLIQDQVADVRFQSKRSEPEVIYVVDAIDYIKIFNYIVKNKIKAAYSHYRSLDTSTRESFPSSVHNLWD